MLENVGRAVQNAHVGLHKSCLEALRTSTWPCLPHRAAQRSPRAPQEAQTPPREALWTRKTRAFNASRPPKPRLGCIFKRKTQPNQCFTRVALVKARVLRVQIAPRCSLFASLLLAPLSRVLPRSSQMSELWKLIPYSFLIRGGRSQFWLGPERNFRKSRDVPH